MRIVFLTFAFQHPQMRGSARSYHFVREIGARHAVTLLALSEVPVPDAVVEDTARSTDDIRVYETGAGRDGRRTERMRAYRDAMGRMGDDLARLHAEEPFDVAVLHGKPLLPVWKRASRLPLVADICDADSMRIRQRAALVPLRRRPAMRAYAATVRRQERQLARATPYVSFISARDRDAVVGPSTGAVVIPNGIDLDYWRRRADSRGSRRLVFTGVMDYKPNEDAAELLADEILPLVHKQVPEAEAMIVGRDARPALIARGERADVTVTGFVDDIRPYLEQAGVFVAPIRFASGQQNKVLEAMAMEVPVVTTPVVAEGLEMDGEAPPVAVADAPGGVAGAVVRLFRDDAERRRLAVEGRRFVERHALWSRSGECLERLCVAAAAGVAVERSGPAATILGEHADR